MSLIHRSGRVDTPPPSLQPDSCSSVLVPSHPFSPATSAGFNLSLSLSFLVRLTSFSLFSHLILRAGSQGQADQTRFRSDQIRKTSAIQETTTRHGRTTDIYSVFESSPGQKSNQNACPVSGQRYVRAATCCFFVHRFLSLVGGRPLLPTHPSIHPFIHQATGCCCCLSLPVVHRNLACGRSRTRRRGTRTSHEPPVTVRSIARRHGQWQVMDDPSWGSKWKSKEDVVRIRRPALPGSPNWALGGLGAWADCWGLRRPLSPKEWVATQTCRGPRKQAHSPFRSSFTLELPPVSSYSLNLFLLETNSSLSIVVHRLVWSPVYSLEHLSLTLWLPKLYSPPGCLSLGALTPEDPTFAPKPSIHSAHDPLTPFFFETCKHASY